MDRIVDEGIKGDLMVDGKRYGLVLDVGGYYKNVITLCAVVEHHTRKRSILPCACWMKSCAA